MPKAKIPQKLEKVLTTNKRFVVIFGGRGSGKSQTITDISIIRAQTRREKILCCREFQNSINDSMYSLINSEVENLQVPGFSSVNHEIRHDDGGLFIFRGLARNPESIKSMSGVNLAIIEEAQTISETSLKILTPTIREKDSQLFFIGNPRSSEDPFSKRFINPFKAHIQRDGFYEDDLHLIIECNWRDNPWFPHELEMERRYDQEHLSDALYRHIWEGEHLDEVEDAIIEPEWFNACIDAHEKIKAIKPKGAIYAALDPSDEGDDATAITIRHGSIVKRIEEFTTGDGNEGCDWACDIAIQYNADNFIYDADGMGALLRRQISENFKGKKIEVIPYKGSQSPDNPNSPYQEGAGKAKPNKDTFKNKRAQYYIMLRDRIYNTYRAVVHGDYIDPDNMISFDGSGINIDKLRAEVCRIPKVPNGNGLIQLMSKPNMKKLGINSPNMSDSLKMSLAQQTKKEKVKLRFDHAI